MLASYVAGSWVEGSGEVVEDRNPARSAEVIDTFRCVSDGQVDEAAEAARAAFPAWAATPPPQRAAVLLRAADLLVARADAYGEELSREEGKTRPEGVGEVLRAADVLRYHAAEANQEVGEVYGSARPGEQIWTLRVPVGPIAAITPWNFPIFIPAFKVGPALVHGNTVVWKPSELVPLLAVRLVEVLEEAGLPAGVLNLVLGDGAAAARLIDHPAIRACSFTGSTAVGSRVVRACADRGIKVQAEMGGKNTAVVFEDADLDLAVGEITSGAMRSTGQKCTATSRVVVKAAVHDELVARLAERAGSLVVGDPLEAGVEVGPLASQAQLEKVLGHIEGARAEGARALCGGGRGADGGWFVEPTVLAGVEPGHRVYTEEVFGPVVAVVSADSDDEAFRLANEGPYGLSGSVFTSDFGRILRASRELEVGVLHVNSETTGADVHVPFGGIKASGTAGREQGKASRDFYTEVRTVYASAP